MDGFVFRVILRTLVQPHTALFSHAGDSLIPSMILHEWPLWKAHTIVALTPVNVTIIQAN